MNFIEQESPTKLRGAYYTEPAFARFLTRWAIRDTAATVLEPMLGRGFTPGDEAEGAAKVAVLAEPFWRSRFGADTILVGRTIQRDGEAVEVVGVVPTASFLSAAEMFLPLQLDAKARAVRDKP